MTAAPATPTTDLVLLILQGAHDLIEPEGAWTQKAFGRDTAGDPCGYIDGTVSWSGDGAVYRTEWELRKRDFEISDLLNASGRVITLLDRAVPSTSFGYWQDEPKRTQAEVVDLFRGLIEYRRLEIDRGTVSMEALEEATRDNPLALVGE